MNVPLFQADITNKEIKEVLEVLRSQKLSIGPKVKEFEEKLAGFAGVKYAVAVNSGTSALHLIIRALGIKDGDEVITSPFSFIASANCILFERAKPVFVDIKGDTLNINPELIQRRITQKTKAILAPDMFAHPADWDALSKIAKKHNLFLIEDSAESVGSEYRGKRCGNFGDASIFAFSPNKQITIGEGGMVLTDNEEIANFCRSSASQGRKIEGGKWLEHIRLGYNYRLNEMSCAVGLSQLRRIKDTMRKRQKAASLYNKKLKYIKDIEIPYVAKDVKLHWWIYVIKLIGNAAGKRDIVMEKLKERGIESRDYYKSIHLQPFYKEILGFKEGDFPVCEDISKRTIALPFFNDLRENQIDFVVRQLKAVLNIIK
ncbi:MAG: DegT/DnrJ/EryC1/StrS family aminotransferase [Patescibacteria group bacterium]